MKGQWQIKNSHLKRIILNIHLKGDRDLLLLSSSRTKTKNVKQVETTQEWRETNIKPL